MIRSRSLRQRSARMARLMRVYLAKREQFLEHNPWCLRCGGAATEVHHKAGRVGDLLLDDTKWAAMCHECHVFATEHPAEAIERGWSLPRIGRHDTEDGAA